MSPRPDQGRSISCQALTSLDLTSFGHIHLSKVAVDGEIIAVTYDYIIIKSLHHKYGGHLAIKDRLGFGSRILPLDIDTIIIYLHIFRPSTAAHHSD